jgi:hypothetical protein
MILGILGYPVAVALSTPGGLFEIILDVLLVVKGFPAGAARTTRCLTQIGVAVAAAGHAETGHLQIIRLSAAGRGCRRGRP